MRLYRVLLAAALLCVPCAANAAEIAESYAAHGMVSAAHELAAEAGVEIMRNGGNAIDAAVATALALNVVEFNASGIGGGGFTTFYSAETGEVVCLDYREAAPASTSKEMYASDLAQKEKWSVHGGKSVAVPGWLMGMDYALKNYGTMSFAQVAGSAIRLAEDGFIIRKEQLEHIQNQYDALYELNDPEKVPFFDEIGLPVEENALLKQPALAKTFRLIAEKGIDVFYKGEIGEAICDAVNAAGGSMTMDDLAGYRVFVRKPVVGTYRGYTVHSVPPVSSGGAHVIQLLNIMENWDVAEMGFNTPETLHVFAEASKMVFADCEKYMADTAYVNVPLAGILSKDYAAELASRISDADISEPGAGDPWKFEPSEKAVYRAGSGTENYSTSSFSVADRFGNIVASTNTINHFMGSAVIVPEYGFLLNDEMDDFSHDPESVNAPELGKRPLSSMCPTLVFDPDGRPFMTIGSPGASRIITAVAQCLMNVIDHGMAMDAAVEAARFHCQSGNLLETENDRYDAALLERLKDRGYEISLQPPLYTGGAQGIMFDWDAKDTGRFLNGGADSRRLGTALGF